MISPIAHTWALPNPISCRYVPSAMDSPLAKEGNEARAIAPIKIGNQPLGPGKILAKRDIGCSPVTVM
jgi:hypothetical protein